MSVRQLRDGPPSSDGQDRGIIHGPVLESTPDCIEIGLDLQQFAIQCWFVQLSDQVIDGSYIMRLTDHRSQSEALLAAPTTGIIIYIDHLPNSGVGWPTLGLSVVLWIQPSSPCSVPSPY